MVAAELGADVDVIWVDRFDQLLSALDEGKADLAVAPLTPTAERVVGYDFTSSVIASGPQLGYHKRLASTTGGGRDDDGGGDFHPDYVRGIWDGFWWATVTVTTAGYGDTAPRSFRGRSVALLAMLLSLFLVGAFVSQVTDIVQTARAEAPVSGLDDVGTRRVGVVEGSSFARYVIDQGVATVAFPNQAELFEAAERGDVDLVVSNPFALATVGGDHGIEAVGDVFYTEFETFALPKDSPWQEPINQVLAGLQSSGEIDEIVDRWLEDG